MLELAIFLVGIGAMAAFDAWVSARRMAAYGIDKVELSPAARLFYRKGGRKGLIGGLVGSSMAIGLLAYLMDPRLLIAFAGFKSAFFLLQLKSLAMEKEIGDFLRSRNEPPAS